MLRLTNAADLRSREGQDLTGCNPVTLQAQARPTRAQLAWIGRTARRDRSSVARAEDPWLLGTGVCFRVLSSLFFDGSIRCLVRKPSARPSDHAVAGVNFERQ